MKKSFKGFTLVEVLIVIIIVGILIAALLPRLVGSQARARDVARGGGINQIAQGLALMSADNVTFDASIDAEGDESGATSTQLPATYLASVPTDPNGANVNLGGCTTAGQYCIANLGTKFMVFGVSETGKGNCNVVAANLLGETDAGYSAPDLSLSDGDYQCVIVN